ncbi:penicillin-binding protein 1C [Azospirillum halopraeferens]|uniref:penicillin-binding protein 1C n=1 Tax=Azospirillum halopraeferens TaxID=34010 RepID=UPI0004215083|nr:penicillin-binding protein 1C [Azospirillum halopraeferens]
MRAMGRAGAVALAAGLVLLAVAAGLDRAFPPDLTRYHDRSAEVADRNGVVLRAFTAGDDAWRFAVTPDAVAPLYRAMLVAYEDKRFAVHPGVDPLAVVRAAGQALWHGKVVSGASTLTMQAARLLEPRPRTVAAKLIEMARALQLEWRFTKDEILAIYLTLAPFGGNLEGVRAASLAYFGKEPRHLTPAEAALLVALPQSPTRLRPDRGGDGVRRARDKVLDRAVGAGLLTAAAAEAAAAAPVPSARRPFPFLAPHLAERLRATRPGEERIVTTLDAGLQETAEGLLHRLAEGLDPRAGVAALVVDNATREVRAYVGSGGYFDERRNGMVDMVQAVRSPGSTLKPFIYAMAFDRLIVHPMTVIADVPRRFGGYAPENFGGGFAGEVTVGEALQRSLNVPAVALLDRVGPLGFDAALRAVGVTLRFDRRVGRPTLPIALGGVGLTLEELVTLYGAFSHGGGVAPLRTLPAGAGSSAGTADGGPLMGESAAWYVARVLRGAPRPPGYADPEGAGDARRIAFKTGTSYGYRDAWAIGFTDSHTAGVWVGRPDGTPCLRCVGLETAAPVLFRLFDLLPDGAGPAAVAARPPPGVITGTTADLPPVLRRFADAPAVARHGAAEAAGRLRIAFPVDGSVVSLGRDRGEAGRLAALPLRAEGGRRPLRWLINDRPLGGGDWRRGASWRPDGAGFVDVKVLDADGNVSTATVFVAARSED